MTRSKRMSSQDLDLLIARSREPGVVEDPPESKLVSEIVAFCKKQGWPILSFPQTPAVKRFLPPGWPDITIKLPRGITLDIEAKKAKKGRLSPEQKLMKAMFVQLGHEIDKVDTWDQFMELIEKVR